MPSSAALLLFGSGFCALVYQTAWLRSLRLVFGGSTLATAAVLAIFMGGLGLGGLLLGRRVDRTRNPLRLYGHLELAVGALAIASPFLIELVQAIYVGLGGTSTLGDVGGTLLRLVLATLVLGAPAFLMGGTLPAVARAVETEGDTGRRGVAFLYGANTMGAVTGAFVSTFVALEVFGVRTTVVLFGLVNVVIGLAARALSRGQEVPLEEDVAPEPTPETAPEPARRAWTATVLVASGLVGFAFLLMELVWYRMLAPLLGGSSYTFGLILAFALLGIGLGGLLYSRRVSTRAPTMAELAWTCGLEAALLAVPLVVGDHLAVLGMFVREYGNAGFLELVLGWSAITAIVVLPGALVSGYQFPLLIGLMGSGRRDVGQEVGRVYATNTVGAIAGSLLGGFVLLPALTAVGAWRLAVALLLVTGVAALAMHVRATGRLGRALILPLALVVVAVPMASARGPTAFWRHSPIGVGLMHFRIVGANDLEDRFRRTRREIVREWEGVESSVAISRAEGDAFVVSGKVDGNARLDAPTQVMSGLVGALVHPGVARRAMVIGLGTGSTAGWLAAMDEVERVDVVELEPAIVEVARMCAPVNEDVLDSPKVDLTIGDAREVLTTRDAAWDLVFSEPSNPYRAGISSLFTRDFYEAVEARLAPGGVFVQWMQAYHIDPQTIRTILATLRSVFPSVQVWESKLDTDFIFVATREPLVIDMATLARRVGSPVVATAMRNAWGVEGVEGFLTAFVAGPGLADTVAREEGEAVATDDLNLVEYGFARAVGRRGLFEPGGLRAAARAMGQGAPAIRGAPVSGARVAELRSARRVMEMAPVRVPPRAPEAARARIAARAAFAKGDLKAALTAWRKQSAGPMSPIDRMLLAEALAEAGDPGAPDAIAALRRDSPTQAAAVQARYLARTGQLEDAAAALTRALTAYRTDPWPLPNAMGRAIDLAIELSTRDAAAGRRLFEVLAESPFAVGLHEAERRFALTAIANAVDFDTLCVPAIESYGEHFPWEGRFLRARARCYHNAGHPDADAALEDLEAFVGARPEPFRSPGSSPPP